MRVDVAVIGAGTMGAGIAQTAVTAGLSVVLYDVFPRALDRAAGRIALGLTRMVDGGKLSAEERSSALGRFSTVASLDDIAAATFVIEAVPEDLDLKRAVFRSVSQVCAADTVLATNTSSLSITKIAGSASFPERVAGMHFFNPVPVMRLVEVIPARQTSAATIERVAALATTLGKTPVRAKDTPGFIVNRVTRHFYGEALRAHAEGVPVEIVDRIMKDAGGFKMGPFELMDLIGIDVSFAVTRSIFDAFFGDSRYRPHPLQEQMIDAGMLGRKTGRGFYPYDSDNS